MTCSTKLLLMAITVLTLWLQISQAYCVYNRLDGADSYFYVKEREVNPRASFKKQINNGERECCPWNNGECNLTGKQEGIVDFHITIGMYGASLEGADTFFAFCSAGGGLVITGNNLYNITATCNHADGKVNTRPIFAIEK
ncbi:hypothetical protein BDF21DRAFT_396581 [Thamnidium elegans]|uniref:Uncharacterized protein n=1 Tax=Thamnidium elegans TaxID=101142 RepID=A0A8H7VUJ2_9FUNG|nr:hypothetical protein INT48_001883 [Thamnidium elegans]KAI8088431.1 hypothetical protein BDF21DRAFT_396581 [Thamnidium elegans]